VTEGVVGAMWNRYGDGIAGRTAPFGDHGVDLTGERLDHSSANSCGLRVRVQRRPDALIADRD
jgi:hypothetical protein